MAGDLRALEDSVEERAATDGIAPELSDVHDEAGAHQKEAGEIAVLAAVRQP